jgi:microcystin-dependent protein
MPKAPYFMTGDAITSGYLRVVVSIPRSQQNWLYSVFLGSLGFMTKPEAWITAGESTQDDAAQAYKWILENIIPMPFYAGSIMWSAAPSLPSGAPYLACDGNLYLQTDYPSLYAAIGTTYNVGGEPPGTFRVPDLEGRVLAGVDPAETRLQFPWATALGGTGGEDTHTLTGTETPSHSHTDSGHSHGYIPAGANATTIGPGAPQPTAIPSIGVTSSGSANLDTFGADGAHNNTQPTMTMFAYVYTGV